MDAPRQLFVLRHAKSSWDDPQLADHDRPLAPRGLRAVGLLADYLEANGIRPEQVLCSSARRTIETYERVHPTGELSVEGDLYGASASELLERLRRLPADTTSAMLIGHNPAVQMLVLELAGANGGAPASADLREVQRKFPTGALATLGFDCVWRELAPGAAELITLVRPRDLK
jgi:phosphohistidine phosphatase